MTANLNEYVQNVEWRIPEKQLIVAIVDSGLKHGVKIVSKDSQESPRDETSVRDKSSNSSEVKKHLAEVVGEEHMSNAPESTSKETQSRVQKEIAIVVGAFLVGGILGVASNPAEPGSGFLVIGLLFGGLAWALGTESGREFSKNIGSGGQQQQQIGGQESSNPKQVCPECGWQNPAVNNYCHDCGANISG